MLLPSVAAALIGVYIVFALITSHITEAIGSLLNQRGSMLYKGIVELVGDSSAIARAAGLSDAQAREQANPYHESLVEEIYRHPLVSNLSGRTGRKPTYIPARTFTLSFLDEFRKMFVTDANGAMLALPDLLATPDVLFTDTIQRIQGLPDGPLKQTLTTVVQAGDQRYDALIVGIDALFDAAMQRISGWYKRWSAVIVAIAGGVLVVIFNVDTLAIVKELAHNQAQTQALSQAAQQLTSNMSLAQLLDQIPQMSFNWVFPPAGGWWMKIAGLLISWFAVMLGAPFWFDLLQRLVPVRLSGDKPAVTSIQPSGRDVLDVQSASTDAR
ncbi:MAG: hypothetical protein ABI182_05745 [Candidatus Baltobacteraceae bacterium]